MSNCSCALSFSFKTYWRCAFELINIYQRQEILPNGWIRMVIEEMHQNEWFVAFWQGCQSVLRNWFGTNGNDPELAEWGMSIKHVNNTKNVRSFSKAAQALIEERFIFQLIPSLRRYLHYLLKYTQKCNQWFETAGTTVYLVCWQTNHKV